MEYGYYQDGMAVEIIADGHHVPSSLLHLIVKVKGHAGNETVHGYWNDYVDKLAVAAKGRAV